MIGRLANRPASPLAAIAVALALLAGGACRERPASEGGEGSAEPVTTILLPVLLGAEPLEAPNGRSWSTVTITTWPGEETLWVGVGGQPVAIVPGVARPAEFRRNELSGALVIIPVSAADRLKIDHFLRDESTGDIVNLATPRGDRAAAGPVVLEAANVAGESRMLRIYDLVSIADGRVAVTVESGGERLAERELALVDVGERGVHFAELDLTELELPAGGDLRITLQPTMPEMRVWAMLVRVDAATGAISIEGPAEGGAAEAEPASSGSGPHE